MDAYTISSMVRSYSGLDNETELGTPQLRRLMNLGMQRVAQLLMPLYHEFLIKTHSYASATGASVDVPADLLRILDIEREDANGTMRLTTEVPAEDKGQVNKNVNFMAADEYPLHVHEGRSLLIWPTLATTDVNVRYRKRIIDLVQGPMTYGSATTVTLSADAIPEDDYYNGYDLTLYQDDSDGVVLIGTYKITDYVGSTKLATLSGSSLTDVTMMGGLVPLIPAEYHETIVEATIANLKRIPKYAEKIGGSSWVDDLAAMKANISDLVAVNTGMWPKRVGEVK